MFTMSKLYLSIFFFLSVFLLQSCATQAVQNNDDGISVGTVQKEISVGMIASDVVTILGSPNIVTTNDIGGETWVYDKVSRDVSYENSSSGASLLLIGGFNNSGSSSSSQKTLTIIINFDSKSKVSTLKYHTSTF
jgi:outer membrane protein assembly factor BamE (lipoprotein component of BamABCDE complex)